MKKIIETLENASFKILDRTIYIVNKIAYKKTRKISVRKGKTQLERSLRGLIFIPATFVAIFVIVVFILPLNVCKFLDKRIGGKC